MLFYAVTQQVKAPKTDGPFEDIELEVWIDKNLEGFLKHQEEVATQWLMN